MICGATDHLPPGQANEKLSNASAATTSTTAERIVVEEDALGDSGATFLKIRDMAGEYLYMRLDNQSGEEGWDLFSVY